MTDAERVVPAHRQTSFGVRLEWGPTGAAAIAADADVAVVVDVLSFTTTLTLAVERGIEVYPFRWRDDRAAAFAAAHDAVLAVGRSEGRARGGLSLSPGTVLRAEGVERLVLPSPNGSTIAFALRDGGATVVGASLRNASAVGRWLARQHPDATIAVLPAGERWTDGSLRPAVEDLWGAGAVVAALVDALGRSDASPEAVQAAQAFTAVRDDLATALAACASGQELVDAGYPDDVRIAAELDRAEVVPVLDGEAFSAARAGGSPPRR